VVVVLPLWRGRTFGLSAVVLAENASNLSERKPYRSQATGDCRWIYPMTVPLLLAALKTEATCQKRPCRSQATAGWLWTYPPAVTTPRSAAPLRHKQSVRKKALQITSNGRLLVDLPNDCATAAGGSENSKQSVGNTLQITRRSPAAGWLRTYLLAVTTPRSRTERLQVQESQQSVRTR